MKRTLSYERVADILPAVVNAKRHDEGAVDRSLSRFGYVEPVIIDERTGRLVAGHGRLDALRRAEELGGDPPLGIVDDGGWRVPVVRGWSSNSDDEAHALGVALNQTTISAGWDWPGLADLLQDLDDTSLLSAIGFKDDDLRNLLNADTADWKPPGIDDIDGFRLPVAPLRLSHEEREVVDEALALVRDRHGADLTDGQAVVTICRDYLAA